MAIAAVDEAMLREPRLLQLKKQPIGPVKPNATSDLSKKTFCFFLGAQRKNVLDTRAESLSANVEFQKEELFLPPSVASSGLQLCATNDTALDLNPDGVGLEFTICVDFRIDSIGANGTEIFIVASGASMSTNYWNVYPRSNGSAISIRFGWYLSALTTGAYSLGLGDHQVIVTRDSAATVTMYVDGRPYASVSFGTVFYNRLLNKSSLLLNTAGNGNSFAVYSMFLSRAWCSAGEAASLYQDPYQFLVPA
jgi:hypothetical protein